MPFARRRPGAADILYLMAVEKEYGPQLRARIDPVMTGVGPVEAAIVTTAALAERQVRGELPLLAVSLGSAGSRGLKQGAVYQATTISYRDMDASALGFERGVTPFLGLEAVLKPGPLVPRLMGATLSTGGNIVSGAGYDAIDAEMVDMESYAVLRACQRFSVPLIVLRGISDGDAELGELEDWTRYLHVVDENLAAAVDMLEAAVAAGTLS